MSFSISRVIFSGLMIAWAGSAVADDHPLLEGDEPYLTYDELSPQTRPRRSEPAPVDQNYAADPDQSYVTERRENDVAQASRRARPRYAQNTPYCREYRTSVMSGGQERFAYGTACQQPDGTWKIISAPSPSWSSARAMRAPDRYPNRYRYYPNLFER